MSKSKKLTELKAEVARLNSELERLKKKIDLKPKEGEPWWSEGSFG